MNELAGQGTAPTKDMNQGFKGAADIVGRISNLPAEPSIEEILKAFDFLAQPVNSHIFVRIDNFRYKGAIIIPEQAKRQPTKGLVVACSDVYEDQMGVPHPMPIKVGDHILYSQFAGYLLKFEDTPVCRCLSYREVLCILKEGTPDITMEGA